MLEQIDKAIEIAKIIFGLCTFVWAVKMLNNSTLTKINREFGAFIIVCGFTIATICSAEMFLAGFGVFVGARTVQKIKDKK